MPDPTVEGSPRLEAADFAEFYQKVHGYPPFPWQSAVVAQVLVEGRWPDLVDVPTGLGKTSMLDVAVFVAAATVGTPAGQRLGRRRCFFVVDRRIVVDEAAVHAQLIQQRLNEAEQGRSGGVLGAVAAGLRAYAPDAAGPLLPVTTMRGGTAWADAWLDRPDRSGIVLGTVDQVGSRLLFRGYGVSDRRRPIDAALVGTDALLLVDEAHLSEALLTTVDAARERDRLGLPLPGLDVVQLSATGTAATHPFTLDIDTHLAEPVARQRLTAGKRLTLREASVKDCARVLADTVAEKLAILAGGASAGGYAPVAAVVCNTVDRARAVHGLLAEHLTVRGVRVELQRELLIGRSRPIDRDGLQEHVLATFGTDRLPSARPAVLVATQTVEVGVNLDVDVLVTESASWDALVQRLGRLNRLGEHGTRYQGRAAAVAVAVHDGQEDGPVYGAARDTTWQALTELVAAEGGALDVDPLSCRRLSTTVLAGEQFRRRPQGVPVLLRPTLDAWVQTGPVPLADPPVDPFLHGFGGGVAAVQVIWRDGMVDDDPLDDPFEDGGAELAAADLEATLTQLPPRTPEAVEVPFVAVRQWMLGQVPGAVSDVDTTADDVDARARAPREPIRALTRRPGGLAQARRAGAAAPDAPLAWCWITAAQLRPGDQIVVPAQRGGLDRYGWAPAATTPVDDGAERATFLPGRGRRQGMLRLDRKLPERLGLLAPAATAMTEQLASLADDDEDAAALDDRVRAFAARLAELLPEQPTEGAGWSVKAWQNLRAWSRNRAERFRIIELGAAGPAAGRSPVAVWGSLLVGPIPTLEPDAPALVPGKVRTVLEGPDPDDEEVAASSIGAGQVPLSVHNAAVGARAGTIAMALGLPDGLTATVVDAARWHDLGKSDVRFQIMLHGGDPYEAALAPEHLAKSGMDPADRLAWRRAARRSGLPSGARHAAWSAALAEEYLRTRDTPYAGDLDLLLHLIASHHGHARPLLPPVVDGDPRPVEAVVDGEKVAVASERTVSLDHPARFARLNQRYGRWGLALLEAVVRCADMTVSGEGS